LGNHGGRGLGHKRLVAEFAVGLGDLVLQPRHLFAQAHFFSGHVHFHEQAQAGFTHHRHRCGLGSGFGIAVYGLVASVAGVPEARQMLRGLTSRLPGFS
jgi:hypothetical protein